jgi:hypothetical protein
MSKITRTVRKLVGAPINRMSRAKVNPAMIGRKLAQNRLNLYEKNARIERLNTNQLYLTGQNKAYDKAVSERRFRKPNPYEDPLEGTLRTTENVQNARKARANNKVTNALRRITSPTAYARLQKMKAKK